MASTPSSPNPTAGEAASPRLDITTTASPDDPPGSPAEEEPDSPDLPLTMSASTLLMSLPRDATAALAAVPGFPKPKVPVRFKPVGNAPTFQIRGGMQANVSSTQKFEVVARFLRKQLKVSEQDHVFLYINNTFAPSLDEVVGNLWMCFKDSSNQLNVSYSLTPAFG
ncbi:ubiquitin-like autophagy protein Apg12 [Thozetella sp. PMI_491]|nr:ubiquitin-like autophagy protein Apg12 [Thozetella sp. PMI_491]